MPRIPKEKEPINYHNLSSFKYRVKELGDTLKVSKALRSQILKDLRTIDFKLQEILPYLYRKQTGGYTSDIRNDRLVDDCEYIISKYERILKQEEIEIALTNGVPINQ